MDATETAQQEQSETKSVPSISTNTDPKEDGPWQDLRLPEKFGEILKIGCKVDCKFIVGPKSESAEIIFGHKWMFAVESPVFERMFCGDFMESKDGTAIRLPDDDPVAFRNLRRMLYNTRTSQFDFLNFEETIKLYKMCDKYMVISISKLCVDHIKTRYYEDITNTQLLTLFAVALELQNLDMLKDVKEKLLSKEYPLISDLNNFNVVQFVEYIQLYLANNNANANHFELFNTIEAYLTHHQLIPESLLKQDSASSGADSHVEDFHRQEVKWDLLDRLLACVDFGKIAIDTFLTGPGVSNILTWKQKYFILSQLASVPCEKCDDNSKYLYFEITDAKFIKTFDSDSHVSLTCKRM